MGAQTCNTSTGKKEAEGHKVKKPAYTMQQIPGQPGLYSETLSQENKVIRKVSHFKIGKQLQCYYLVEILFILSCS